MPQELKLRAGPWRRWWQPVGLLLALVWATASASALDMDGAAIRRSVAAHQVPDVSLVRQDGKRVAFRRELDDGRPVVLAFIFTSCTAICPAISQTLARFQSLSDGAGQHAHIMSVTIDPEQDTPAELRNYAAHFHAGPSWQHYTGDSDDIVAVQRAFGVYAGDKMNHASVYFLRPAAGAPWVRLDGMVPAGRLVQELDAASRLSRTP